jgi:hypothetical protein
VHKALLGYADQHILDRMLSDEYYRHLFVSLEQLPELQGGGTNCREFLEKAKFKLLSDDSIVNKNEVMRSKIHIIYRAQYLKDVVFARDEQTLPQGLTVLVLQYSLDVLIWVLTGWHSGFSEADQPMVVEVASLVNSVAQDIAANGVT